MNYHIKFCKQDGNECESEKEVEKTYSDLEKAKEDADLIYRCIACPGDLSYSIVFDEDDAEVYSADDMGPCDEEDYIYLSENLYKNYYSKKFIKECKSKIAATAKTKKFVLQVESHKIATIVVEANDIEEAISLAEECPEEYMDEQAFDESSESSDWCVSKPKNYSPNVDTVNDIVEYQKNLGYGIEVK